jgi:hypothetical protein
MKVLEIQDGDRKAAMSTAPQYAKLISLSRERLECKGMD